MALSSRRSLGHVIDDALRILLADRGRAADAGPVALPVAGRGGLQPGVDLEDKEALATLLGDDGPGPSADR